MTEGGSMSWYIDIDEGKLEGEISWDLELGWERYIGEGRFVGMHRFDASGKIADVYKKFDINAEAVVRAARRWRRLPLYDIEDPDVGRSRPAASAPSRSVNVSP